MTSRDDEETWDQRLLALLPKGVDESQLAENLRLTPTQRVEKMLAMVAFIEEHRGSARNPRDR